MDIITYTNVILSTDTFHDELKSRTQLDVDCLFFGGNYLIFCTGHCYAFHMQPQIISHIVSVELITKRKFK